MRPRIFLASYYDRELIAAPLLRLREAAEVIIPPYQGRNFAEDELIARLDGMDAVIAADEPYSERVFASANRLKIIARDGEGINSIDMPAATRNGVLVANAPVVAEAAANLAMGLIVCLVRKVLVGDRAVRSGNFSARADFLCPDLQDKTIGIVGLGKIGRGMVKRARSFSMRVLACAPSLSDEQVREIGADRTELEPLLRQSDIISLHTPLTSQTHHLIGKTQFELMKKGAYLVNTSRGPVVDEQMLVNALESGRLAGAALDVYESEPPDPNSPLLRMDNVVLTPHVGGDTSDTMVKAIEAATTNILEWLRGNAPPNLRNPEAWAAAQQKRVDESVR
jgi:phosphoglycerate dehydrogenase-like enzyme